MKQLEQIVQELESGDLPLEKAIKKSEKLDETEKRITMLLRDQEGNISEKPFITDE
jgi:exodeoxyribonuclease VII small subunit